MTNALLFILRTLTELYLFLYLLRFWLPFFRADFRNPVAQGVLRFTAPVVVPLRRVIPPIGRIDTATVLVAFIIEYLLVFVLVAAHGASAGILAISVTAVANLGILSLRLFFFVVLIRVLLSWIAPHNYNPITALLATIAEPILRPFRRIIPPIGGFDISPVFAFVILQALIIVIQTYKPLPV